MRYLLLIGCLAPLRTSAQAKRDGDVGDRQSHDCSVITRGQRAIPMHTCSGTGASRTMRKRSRAWRGSWDDRSRRHVCRTCRHMHG